MSPGDSGYVCDSCGGTGYPPAHAASCPLAYVPRHGARDPFGALPHGFATEPEPAIPFRFYENNPEDRPDYSQSDVSVFDAPSAARTAALVSAAELIDGYRYGITSTADWIGRAVTVIGELTRDG